jgi:Arc/MetJ-type ribon-helix-helix transcriptional regulator
MSDPVRFARRYLEQRKAQLEAENARLREALTEALEEWGYCAQYKGDYLAKKHGDGERIAEWRAVLNIAPCAALSGPRTVDRVDSPVDSPEELSTIDTRGES